MKFSTRTNRMAMAALAAAGLLLLGGCGGAATASDPGAVSSASGAAVSSIADAASSASGAAVSAIAEAASSLPVKDRAGNAISVPASVSRIVSMAPSTTQMLVDLGVGEKVVGIDSYSASFADSLPSDVKQFDMTAPDCETIAALKPDIVFVSELSSSGGPDVFAPLEKAGICVATIPSSSSLSGIEDDIRFVGACTGEAAKAEVLAAGLDTVAGQVKNVTSAITGDDKKSVLFMMSVPTSDAPAIYSFGSGTYMSEILEDIGAVNVCADQQGWVSLTEEDAVAMNPDVILTNVNYLGSDPVTAIESMAGWENVTAIKNKAVYYVDADACSRPNEHVGEAMIEWAAKIYPDIVKKAGLTNTLEKAEAAVSPATEK